MTGLCRFLRRLARRSPYRRRELSHRPDGPTICARPGSTARPIPSGSLTEAAWEVAGLPPPWLQGHGSKEAIPRHLWAACSPEGQPAAHHELA